MPPTSRPLIDERRDDIAKVPLSRAEKALWSAEAAAAGRSLAEHVRLSYEAARGLQAQLSDSIVETAVTAMSTSFERGG